jgi:hypothetical protein
MVEGVYLSTDPDWIEYVRDVLSGVPFDIEGWRRHLSLPFLPGRFIYGSPETKYRNSRGETISFAFGYALYGGDTYVENLPAAQVELFNGKAIVVLHINLFIHFWSLASDLLACPEFLPEVGDPSAGSGSAIDRSKRFGFLPFIDLNFSTLVFMVVALGPRCPVRQRFAIVLRDLFIESVVNHEAGHVLLGHLDFTGDQDRRLQRGGASLSLQDRAKMRIQMELDADYFSANSLAARISTKLRFGPEGEFAKPDEFWIRVHLIVRYFVSFTWLVCDLIQGNPVIESEQSEWFNYPPSHFRMFSSFPTYVSILVDGYGADSRPIALADRRLRQQIISLTDRYDALASLKLGIDPQLARSALAKASSYMEQQRFSRELRPFHYELVKDLTADHMRFLSQLGTNYERSVNATRVSRGLLRECLDHVMQLEPRERSQYRLRIEVVQRHVFSVVPPTQQDAVGMAVTVRLEALATAAPGDPPFSVMAAGEVNGFSYCLSDLLNVAADEPLRENEMGELRFDHLHFWNHVAESLSRDPR